MSCVTYNLASGAGIFSGTLHGAKCKKNKRNKILFIRSNRHNQYRFLNLIKYYIYKAVFCLIITKYGLILPLNNLLFGLITSSNQDTDNFRHIIKF